MKNALLNDMAQNCLAVKVRVIGRSVSNIYDHAVAGHGVTIAQVNLLTTLGITGPCAPGRLGEVLQLERSTVSRNLEQLIQNGWVEVVLSDAKGVREIRLAPEGLRKLKAVYPSWKAAQQRAGTLLGETGVTAVRQISDLVWTKPNATA